jgi:hypothetical protein
MTWSAMWSLIAPAWLKLTSNLILLQGAEETVLFPVAALQPAEGIHPGAREDEGAAQEQGRPLTAGLRSFQRKLTPQSCLRSTFSAFYIS